MIAVSVATCLFALGAVLTTYRWARRRSRLLSLMFVAGVAGRVILGVMLFVISNYKLPVLEGLQAGGGFWTLAIDAQSYFGEAARAARQGLFLINDADPSPGYLRVLAVWMKLTTISPVSVILFNLLCYVALAAIIIGLSQSERVAVIALAAVAVDPALVIFSTQVLKDSLSVLVIAAFMGGIRLWSGGFDPRVRRKLPHAAAGLLLMTAGVYMIGGIRAYLGVLMIASVLAAGLAAVLSSNAALRGRIVVGYVVLLAAVWAAFAQGAGPYYKAYRAVIQSAALSPSAYLRSLDLARSGFAATAGGTSFGGSEASEAGSAASQAWQTLFPEWARLRDRPARVLRGLAVLFVPVSVLQALSVVSFHGGRGLLLVTDFDTVVIDLTLAVSLYLLWKHRRQWLLSSVVCGTVLAVLTTILMAYVVTNFGTMFRLRLLAALPFWLLPVVSLRASEITRSRP